MMAVECLVVVAVVPRLRWDSPRLRLGLAENPLRLHLRTMAVVVAAAPVASVSVPVSVSEGARFS